MPITIALVAAVAGVASAVFQAAPLTGSLSAIMIWYFAQLPLFLVGLSLGTGAGVLAGGVATVLLALFGGIVFAISSMAFHAPAVLVARQVVLSRADGQGGIEWYPAGRLLVGMIGAAALLFLAAFLWGSTDAGGLEQIMRAHVADALKNLAFPPDWTGPRVPELTLVMAHVFPAVIAVLTLTMTIVNGVLAQGILRRAGRNLRPVFEFRTMELPRWYHMAVAVSALGVVFGGTAGFVGINLFLIFVLGYYVQGLAVIHTLLARWSQKYLWLTATYLLLFLVMGPATVLVVLLGAIEPWVQLRRRVTTPTAPWR
jgi:hypothetical protein